MIKNRVLQVLALMVSALAIMFSLSGCNCACQDKAKEKQKVVSKQEGHARPAEVVAPYVKPPISEGDIASIRKKLQDVRKVLHKNPSAKCITQLTDFSYLVELTNNIYWGDVLDGTVDPKILALGITTKEEVRKINKIYCASSSYDALKDLRHKGFPNIEYSGQGPEDLANDILTDSKNCGFSLQDIGTSESEIRKLAHKGYSCSTTNPSHLPCDEST